MLDPAFEQVFRDAKARIREMHYRFGEETYQNRQARLEIYCAIFLGTPLQRLWHPLIRIGS